MIQVVQIRKKQTEKRALELFINLQNIQKNVETGELHGIAERKVTKGKSLDQL